MLDQILYEVALEFHTNDFTIFFIQQVLMYAFILDCSLDWTASKNKFKNGFMVSIFIQTEIRNWKCCP